MLDHVGAWYLLGLMVAAGFEAAVDRDPIAGIGAPLDVLLGALLALPVYWCALATIPLSMMLIHKGVSLGAAVSFLVVAAACNGAVLVAVRRALGWRATAAFAGGALTLAVGLGLVSNALVPGGSVPDVHALLAHRHSAPEWVASVIVGALLTLSLLRAGPRPWLGAALGGPSTAGLSHAPASFEGRGRYR